MKDTSLKDFVTDKWSDSLRSEIIHHDTKRYTAVHVAGFKLKNFTILCNFKNDFKIQINNVID